MGMTVKEELKVALLLLTMSNLVESQTIIAKINALSEQTTAWNYDTNLLIEEAERMAQKKKVPRRLLKRETG